jgi:putative ABC transport system permease protein
MSQRDLLRIALGNLNRMRTRVVLTAIGVIIGTAAVVVLISLAVGLQTSATRELTSFGDLTVIQVFQDFPFSDSPAGSRPSEPESVLDEETLDGFRELPHVVAVTPSEGLQGQGELKLGRQTTYANIQGVDADAAEKLGWKLASGLPRLGRGQIVIGQSVFGGEGQPMSFGPGGRAVVRAGAGATPTPLAVATRLQGRALALTLTKFDEANTELKRSERLRVAGVFEESSGENDYSVYVGLDDLEAFNQWFSGKRRNPRDGYGQVLVKVDDPENVTAVQRQIRAQGFESFSSQDILESINQVFLIMQAILGGIGAIALLVAAFGIANTMTMAIYERTKEIGIMKAIGATNRDVLQIFLSEAGVIGFIGGFLGVLLGWSVGKGIDLFVRTQMQGAAAGRPAEGPSASLVITPLWLMAFALAFATVIGLASGIYPALRAASMKPLRALRTE